MPAAKTAVGDVEGDAGSWFPSLLQEAQRDWLSRLRRARGRAASARRRSRLLRRRLNGSMSRIVAMRADLGEVERSADQALQEQATTRARQLARRIEQLDEALAVALEQRQRDERRLRRLECLAEHWGWRAEQHRRNAVRPRYRP